MLILLSIPADLYFYSSVGIVSNIYCKEMYLQAIACAF